ncbi:L-talarate/galactarate dehydratase [Tetragenococcus halophilus]|uniref:L-talarate/galactarate dehydratase n=1 Tax=Tetragenococcus halophilus TaxID=51669 RepID=UPI00209A9DBA|nr:mandelate racemase/muconate lactonizing enzyme family protein [Tetragenococcus halophilus]MCO8289326.1 mandelate racemase/muconate lactonizing enzyme family protein [Tetragenococcus halophilus]MCO8296342.1 mandelate racemase/muconate lactonizing enzyme family protein [Tetragenococcus halophilus]
MTDTIKNIEIKLLKVPLEKPVSDAKVITGKQTPLKEVMITCATIRTNDGREGFGYVYCKRNGGPAQYSLTKEYAPLLIDEDPDDISRLWNKLLWSSISIGAGGVAVQAITPFDIALWDLKAKKAELSISKLLGQFKEEVPCYNTSGGFLQDSIEEVIDNAQKVLSEGAGGIKIKVGQKDYKEDIRRVEALRKALGDDVPIMVDANQQWDVSTALKAGRYLDEYDLVWLEEPVGAYDVEGHYRLSRALETPIATGEMLVSFNEGLPYLNRRAFDVCQFDAPRIGGITQYKKVIDRCEEQQLVLAPHYSMELHLPLVACFNGEVWVEHFEWFEKMGIFNERVEMNNGLMKVPDRPGIGLTLNNDVVRKLIVDSAEFK